MVLQQKASQPSQTVVEVEVEMEARLHCSCLASVEVEVEVEVELHCSCPALVAVAVEVEVERMPAWASPLHHPHQQSGMFVRG